MAGKAPISTHILDTTRGQPAVGVDVSTTIMDIVHTFPKNCITSTKIGQLFNRIVSNRYRCTSSSMETGYWLTIPLQMRMADVRNFCNVMLSVADATSYILPLKSISRVSVQRPFIHLSRYVNIVANCIIMP